MQITSSLEAASVNERKVVDSCVELRLVALRELSFLNFLRLGCRIEFDLDLINLEILTTLKRLFHLQTHIRNIFYWFESFNIFLVTFLCWNTKCLPSITLELVFAVGHLSALALDRAKRRWQLL